MKTFICVLSLCFCSFIAEAGANYQAGKIIDLTATSDGLMIKMDEGLPDNCEGTSHGWMLVKKEDTAIISVVLATWMAERAIGTVYTSGRENGAGYCRVNQFDPQN